MAGTLCLADVQLTAFQAYKKLIKLKIEFVTINCQEYCQHFQPRSALGITTGRSVCWGQWGGRMGLCVPSQNPFWVGSVVGKGFPMSSGVSGGGVMRFSMADAG